MLEKILLKIISVQTAIAQTQIFNQEVPLESAGGRIYQADPFAQPAGHFTSPPAGTMNSGGGVDFSNPLGVYSFQDLVTKILNSLLILATPIVVIMVVWAAFIYITSGGVPQKVQQANKTILYAVIGYAVLLLATGIVYLVRYLLLGY